MKVAIQKKTVLLLNPKKIILYSVGCADYSQAETVAQEMLEKGCAAIDLCGAFGNGMCCPHLQSR